MPVLKRPHWKWEIVLYFWIGGIAVGAYVTAALADLFGDRDDDILARTGRLIALPMLVLSPILLIKDLGRPEKFYNMLRIIKLRSPMSVGTWVLTTFGAFSGLSAILELFFYEPRWRWLRRLTAILGTPGAIAVGGYTGILLSATAIPLWFKNRLLWGPTFLASAFSTGSAAIQVVLALRGKGNPASHEKLERAHMTALVAETVLLGLGLAKLGRAGHLLTKGKWSTLFWPGVGGIGLFVPLLLGVLPGEPGRSRRFISAICTLVGGLIFRACVVYGGQTSADEAHTYFDMTSK